LLQVPHLVLLDDLYYVRVLKPVLTDLTVRASFCRSPVMMHTS
jgi:hypothetical protein